MNLETVGKLVARHTGSPEEIQRRQTKAELDRAIASRMVNWVVLGLIVMGIGILMIVVNKTFDIGKWFRLVATLTTLGGMGVMVGGVLNSLKQGVQLTGRTPIELATPAEQKSLPTNPFPEALPSVTERTTQLINSSDLQKH